MIVLLAAIGFQGHWKEERIIRRWRQDDEDGGYRVSRTLERGE
jgi:hypothetical protein